MIRRSTKIFLEILLALILLLTVPTAILLWRLSQGPVAVDFLTPYIEQAFEAAIPNSSVSVQTTQLEWPGWSHSIDLQATDLSFRDLEGQIGIALPEVSLKLSTRALIQGVVAPTMVRVHEASIYLVREESGQIRLEYGVGSPTGHHPEGDVGLNLGEFMARLVPDPTVERPLTLLDHVEIVDSTILIVDEKLDRLWSFPLSKLELARVSAGINGDLSFGVGTGVGSAVVDAAFTYDRDTGEFDLATRFEDLNPSILAETFTDLEFLKVAEMPVSGVVSASLSKDEILEVLEFDLTAGVGAVALPDRAEALIDLRSAAASGRYDRNVGKVELETLEMRLGTAERPGPVVSAAGDLRTEVSEPHGGLEAAVRVNLDEVAVDDLSTYWPADLVAEARSWVTENLKKGFAKDLSAEASLLISTNESPLTVRHLSGEFVAEGLDVHYLRPLPPITNAVARASFDLESLFFDVSGGRLGDIAIDGGTVDIFDLLPAEDGKAREKITISAKGRGPARSAFEILDHERLDLLSGFGIDPATSGGDANMSISFAFPLKKDLDFDEVGLSAAGDLTDLSAAKFFQGLDLTNGRLALDLDRAGMRVTGDASLGGVPFEIDWRETFEGNPGYQTLVKAKAHSLDGEGRRQFGVELDDILKGPVAVDLTLTLQADRSGIVETEVDFQDSLLELDPIGWLKPHGAPAAGRFTFLMEDDLISEYSKIWIASDDLEVSGHGRPGADRDLASLTLDRLAFSGGSVEDVEIEFRDESTEVVVGRGWLDAGYFLDLGDAADQEAGEAAGNATSETRDPFSLAADGLTRVVFAEGRQLEDVSLRLEQNAEGWSRFYLRGNLGEPLRSPPRAVTEAEPRKFEPGRLRGEEGPKEEEAPSEEELARMNQRPDPAVTVDYGPGDEGGQRLVLRTSDFGGALKLFNITDAVFGGEIKIKGKGAGPYPTHPQVLNLKGKDFILVRAPMTGTILSMASLDEIKELLQGEGIPMERLEGELSLDDGLLETDLLRIYGAALGITAQGKVDLDKDRIALEGTLVPAYAINSILGEIPIIGSLLIGGEGEGVVAATYTITGSLEEPKIDVNKLSALAPGFLRGLFRGKIEEDDEDEEAVPRALPDVESIAPQPKIE